MIGAFYVQSAVSSCTKSARSIYFQLGTFHTSEDNCVAHADIASSGKTWLRFKLLQCPLFSLSFGGQIHGSENNPTMSDSVHCLVSTTRLLFTPLCRCLWKLMIYHSTYQEFSRSWESAINLSWLCSCERNQFQESRFALFSFICTWWFPRLFVHKHWRHWEDLQHFSQSFLDRPQWAAV
jgi:hypothetical protein